MLPPICSGDGVRTTEVAGARAATQPVVRGILDGCDGKCVRFSPDGTLILTVGADAARIWDAATLAPITAPLPYPGDFVCAGFSENGKAVYLADDTSFRLWDSHTGKVVGQMIRPNDTVRFATLSPDGSKVTFIWAVDSATSKPVIDVYDTKTGKPVLSIPHPDRPRFAAFSPDGHRLLSVGHVVTDWRKFHVWDVDSGKELFPGVESLSNDNCSPGISCAPAAFSPDGKRLAITCGGWYDVLDAHTGKRLAGQPPEYYAGKATGAYVAWLRFVNDGKDMVVVNGERAGLSDAATTKVFLDTPRIDVVNLAVATDGKSLVCEYATEGKDSHNAIGIWDLATARQTLQIGDEQDAGLLDLSPDGRHVAVTGSQRHEDGTVIWNLAKANDR